MTQPVTGVYLACLIGKNSYSAHLGEWKLNHAPLGTSPQPCACGLCVEETVPQTPPRRHIIIYSHYVGELVKLKKLGKRHTDSLFKVRVPAMRGFAVLESEKDFRLSGPRGCVVSAL
ncbi:hypothetical protein NDU88_008456 [Pleurodeles waltl]|uniref:Uncharacterized protein n=1 Tax=Pleurodeles waltl TaxID=8319 RepID=A0AAV7RT42_PLEWA|nr:hypothetical protein NDU88_008456 [Pleurodeles waltl]